MKQKNLSKNLKLDINTFFNVSIDKGTKTNDEVYARLIYYKLYKTINPGVTLMELGKTVNKDHTTVLYSLRKFDTSYIYDKRFKYLYDSFMMHYPEYLHEVYLKEVYTDITKSMSNVIDFICKLEVDQRVMFITQLEELKQKFITNNDVKDEGIL